MAEVFPEAEGPMITPNLMNSNLSCSSGKIIFEISDSISSLGIIILFSFSVIKGLDPDINLFNTGKWSSLSAFLLRYLYKQEHKNSILGVRCVTDQYKSRANTLS